MAFLELHVDCVITCSQTIAYMLVNQEHPFVYRLTRAQRNSLDSYPPTRRSESNTRDKLVIVRMVTDQRKSAREGGTNLYTT